MEVLQLVLIAVTLVLVGGTALSLSHHPHWFVRSWDFPRVQIGLGLMLCAGAAGLMFDGVARVLLVGASGIALGWQGYRIIPYTRAVPVQVPQATAPGAASIRIVVSNVQMENGQHHRWRTTIAGAQPDLIMCLETNRAWREALAPLLQTHPHIVEHIREDYYGMLVLSRFPLIEPEIRFRVDDQVPSIATQIALTDGHTVTLHVLHPPPPEPVRDQSSAERDAELVLLARELESDPGPTVVAGDLNDVAWSSTTRLFQRISGLRDPRIGRGFFNTFDANRWFMRWPLDHVFHTDHFRLVTLRRLPHVGSDHFPILVELAFCPASSSQAPAPPAASAADQQRADESLERVTQETARRGNAIRSMPRTGPEPGDSTSAWRGA